MHRAGISSAYCRYPVELAAMPVLIDEGYHVSIAERYKQASSLSVM